MFFLVLILSLSQWFFIVLILLIYGLHWLCAWKSYPAYISYTSYWLIWDSNNVMFAPIRIFKLYSLMISQFLSFPVMGRKYGFRTCCCFPGSWIFKAKGDWFLFWKFWMTTKMQLKHLYYHVLKSSCFLKYSSALWFIWKWFHLR